MPAIQYKQYVPLVNWSRVQEFGAQSLLPFTERGGLPHDVIKRTTATLNGNAAWGWGPQGAEIRLDGSGDYLNCGKGTNNILGASTFLIQFTCRSTTILSQVFFSRYNTSGNFRSWQIAQGAQGEPEKIRFYVSGDGTGTNTRIVSRHTPLVVGENYRVVGVYRPSNSISIYVNGVLEEHSTTSIPSSLFNSNTDVWIGGRPNSTEYAQADIQQAMICNRALSDSQIRQWSDDPMLLFQFDASPVIYSFPSKPYLVLRRFV